MDKKLKILISIVIIIIIILIVALLYLNNNYNKQQNLNEIYVDEINNQIGGTKSITRVVSRDDFFIVENCIKKYMQYIQENDIEKVYGCLDEEYLENEKITKDNIQQKITKLKSGLFTAKKMYVYDDTMTVSEYFVYGLLENMEYYIIVKVDYENRTFSVLPNYYINENLIEQNTNNIELIKIEDQEISYVQGVLNQNIEKLEYNNIEYIHITDKQMAQKYLEDYINKIKVDIKQAYELLNNNYKQIRFKKYDDFTNFIKNDLLLNDMLEVDELGIIESNNTKKYVVKDQYGRVYIFEETAIMEYTVQLDEYTLENEEYNEKYAKSSNRDKGILNIDKFFKMINMQDYESAYSVLDENFKQNYFKTQADFENYIKSKLFLYNKVEYKEYSNKITDIYTYKVVLTDVTEENPAEIEFNIVMKLLEGTDFVMSFEVN